MFTTLSIAFFSGLISFLSPCVLPLIPGYISYISGTSFDKLIEKKRNLIITKTIFFTLGFSFVFISLGSTASFIGNFFLANSNVFRIAPCFKDSFCYFAWFATSYFKPIKFYCWQQTKRC